MSYSLWHCGVRIGDAELERNPDVPRHLAGIFHPTAYGCRLLPQLTGFFTAAAALKSELKARGLSEASIQQGAGVAELLETTAAGQSAVEVVHALNEVELRDSKGAPVAFRTIAFVDLAELRSVAGRLNCKPAIAALEPVPLDAQVIIVSATLAEPRSVAFPARRIEIT